MNVYTGLCSNLWLFCTSATQWVLSIKCERTPHVWLCQSGELRVKEQLSDVGLK